MAQIEIPVTTQGGSTKNFKDHAVMRLTYSAGGGTITITGIEGHRTDKSSSWQDTAVTTTITIGGESFSRKCNHAYFKTGNFLDCGLQSSASKSGLSGNTTVSVKMALSGISQGNPVWSGTINAGDPTPYYWNDINAYNPGQTAQSGLIFDVSMSNGSS